MSYEIIEGMTRADIAVRIHAPHLHDLFIEAGRALASIVIENCESIRPVISRAIRCEAAAIDLLLHEFLQELIFVKDAEKIILLPAGVDIMEDGDRCFLSAQAQGERIDRTRHLTRTDVKAVTLHGLSVEQSGGAWVATVVLDV